MVTARVRLSGSALAVAQPSITRYTLDIWDMAAVVWERALGCPGNRPSVTGNILDRSAVVRERARGCPGAHFSITVLPGIWSTSAVVRECARVISAQKIYLMGS